MRHGLQPQAQPPQSQWHLKSAGLTPLMLGCQCLCLGQVLPRCLRVEAQELTLHVLGAQRSLRRSTLHLLQQLLELRQLPELLWQVPRSQTQKLQLSPQTLPLQAQQPCQRQKTQFAELNPHRLEPNRLLLGCWRTASVQEPRLRCPALVLPGCLQLLALGLKLGATRLRSQLCSRLRRSGRMVQSCSHLQSPPLQRQW